METNYRLIYRHWRIVEDVGELRPYRKGDTDWEPAPRGGRTECYAYDAEDRLLATGRADCSLRDAFNYRIGRDIARGRALKVLRNNA